MRGWRFERPCCRTAPTGEITQEAETEHWQTSQGYPLSSASGFEPRVSTSPAVTARKPCPRDLPVLDMWKRVSLGPRDIRFRFLLTLALTRRRPFGARSPLFPLPPTRRRREGAGAFLFRQPVHFSHEHQRWAGCTFGGHHLAPMLRQSSPSALPLLQRTEGAKRAGMEGSARRVTHDRRERARTLGFRRAVRFPGLPLCAAPSWG